MPLYTYRCQGGHEAELLRPRDTATAPCQCGLPALRQTVYPLAHIGRATIPRDERSYRHSYGEYREAVAEVAEHYQRVNGERGPEEQVREPDYFGLAKAQAVSKGAPIR